MTIRKDNKTGTYTVDVSNGFNAVTNRRNRIIRKGLKTKKEAIQLENHLRITNLDEQPALRGATLDTLYSIMVTEDLKRDAKASYIETQERNYNKHFKKYFEVARIEKLTYKDMETFRQSLLDKKVNNKSDKTLSNNTVNKQMILMHKLMKIACKHGYIKENPCQYLTKLPIEKKTVSYWQPHEFKLFMSLFKEDEEAYKLIFEVAYTTGMRIGEILALTWKDIDLELGIISVTKTMIQLKGKTITNSPKTKAGERDVTIHNQLVQHLQEWKTFQQKLLIKYSKDPDDLQVFQDVPEPINRFKVTKKYDLIRSRTTELKKIRIHDFRHSHVAFLISSDTEVINIAKRLGHSSDRITTELYGHLYTSKQKRMSDLFQGVY